MGDLDAIVGAGSLRSSSPEAVSFPHRWTEGGVTVESSFTGAHLLHLAVAGCVLNDVYREAERLGVGLDGVRVVASGGFDQQTWQSTGIEYSVQLSTSAADAERDAVLAAVDAVAEIPKAIAAGATVRRVAK